MMRESYRKLCEEFCGICENSPNEHQAECNGVNRMFRRKYVISGGCPSAVINGVSVSILKRDKVMVELGDEWYARDDDKIKSALAKKRERLERERLG